MRKRKRGKIMELIRGICPLLSVATIISGGRSELHACVKECAFTRHENNQFWCSIAELAHCAEYVEKDIRGY